jgi:hypothetical protein
MRRRRYTKEEKGKSPMQSNFLKEEDDVEMKDVVAETINYVVDSSMPYNLTISNVVYPTGQIEKWNSQHGSHWKF